MQYGSELVKLGLFQIIKIKPDFYRKIYERYDKQYIKTLISNRCFCKVWFFKLVFVQDGLNHPFPSYRPLLTSFILELRNVERKVFKSVLQIRFKNLILFHSFQLFLSFCWNIIIYETPLISCKMFENWRQNSQKLALSLL